MRPDTVELAGRQRMVLAGGCRYPTTPPESGMVMGPTDMRELVVVLGTLDGLTLFSYAQTDDIERHQLRRAADGTPAGPWWRYVQAQLDKPPAADEVQVRGGAARWQGRNRRSGSR